MIVQWLYDSLVLVWYYESAFKPATKSAKLEGHTSTKCFRDNLHSA